MSESLVKLYELEAALVVVEDLRLVHKSALSADVHIDRYDTACAWINAQDDAQELGRQYKRACKKEGIDPYNWKEQKREALDKGN